jgi:hypothetical protein
MIIPNESLKFYLKRLKDLKKNFKAIVIVKFIENCKINREKHSFKSC